MGKRLAQQARGRGTPRYLSPSHRFLGRFEYLEYGTKAEGKVIDIMHDPGRSAPLALVKFNGKKIYHVACEGLKVGDLIKYGEEEGEGNVLELKDINIGTKIFGIENKPGSGPKFCRSSGTFAVLVGKGEKLASIQMPSGKIIELDLRCRASIGVAAGGGRVEKPFGKAGKKYYAMKARNKKYPRVVGVAQNPVDHPWGGKSKSPRPSRTVSRWAPPGAKVGSISPKRTGKRKR